MRCSEAMRPIHPCALVPRLAALTLAALATFNIAWAQPIPEGKPLTPAQEASIREEMTALAPVLMSGGKSPQEAKLATHAVGTCIGAAYSYDLSRQQADRVCGLVLDAFIIQPGATHYDLTPDDRAWLQSRAQGWTTELSAVLEPDEVTAVQSTMYACLEGQMERGENREDSVRKCAQGLLPLLNLPELRQRLLEVAGSVR
jgi:hypothetical protein